MRMSALASRIRRRSLSKGLTAPAAYTPRALPVVDHVAEHRGCLCCSEQLRAMLTASPSSDGRCVKPHTPVCVNTTYCPREGRKHHHRTGQARVTSVILTVEKSMETSCSALALVAMSLMFTAAASGAGQDRIPELQRDAATVTRNETLTGCVTRGTKPDTYTLTNVIRATEGAAKVPAGSMTVALSSTEVDFSRHLDHRVAVTGSQAHSWPASGTTGVEKPDAPDARTEGDTKTNPMFTVTSLKIVADTCATPEL
jgi:hypothetical protein